MDLAQKINQSDWMNERSINIVDPYFSISFNCVPQKLQIGLNTYLEGTAPRFGIRLRNDGYLDIGSKVQISIAEFQIQAIGGSVYSYTSQAICNKNGNTSINFGDKFSIGVKIVRILFKTSDTFYLRYYKTLCRESSDNTWDWSPVSQYNLN